jgi:pimeloyl-ACP methyl ester carboxylesterase
MTRTMPWTFHLLRHGFQGLRRVSPALASRVSQALFLLPPRHPEPPAEREALASGRAFRLPFRGSSLAAWAWGPRQGFAPTVLLVHGWGGRAGQLRGFIGPLVDAGFRVVAFDGPAHGRSGGRQASILHFAEALEAVAARVGPVHGLVAHSMGCAGAAVALARGLDVERACFVAPPSRARTYYEGFLRFLGLPEPWIPEYCRRFSLRLGFAWERVEVPAVAPGLRTALRVFHDEGDREVAFAEGQAIAAAWPGAGLRATQGLGHRRILKDPEVIQEAVDFLGRPAFRTCPERFEAELFDRDLRATA